MRQAQKGHMYMSEKTRLVPIPTPANPEADRGDLSKPFPIEYGGRFYRVLEDAEAIAFKNASFEPKPDRKYDPAFAPKNT